MKRLILTVAIAALAVPSIALGKGPSAASIDGPGAGGGISFTGDEGSGPLGDLTEQSGFFPAVFDQRPDPMVSSRPKGDLGPKYTITYTVPGPDNDVFTIHQDVYPYATPAPVTYLKPGQKIFDMETRGGWFQADSRLKETLVSAGLPARAPTASSEESSFPIDVVGVLAAALLLATATTLVVRRRMRPAQAT